MILAMVLASAAGGTPTVFDFKGVPLGISLEDFRRTPHPDGTTATVVCTGEKVPVTKNYSSEPPSVAIYDGIEKSLGVVRCVWIDILGIGEYHFNKGQTASLSLANSGYASYHYSFSFIRDPRDGVMRLYEYSGSTNVAAFAATVKGLSDKWGAPSIKMGTVQNKIGNSFDQEIATWSSSSGSIVVESRWSKIDDMNLTMRDARLSKIIRDARAASDAAKPNAI